MANDNNIEQRIKDGFEGISHKAPEFLWSSINSQLNEPSINPIDQKVKSSFQGVNAAAPDRIWAEIDKQLTIDQGWRKTLILLRRRTGWKWTKRVAAFSVFLFFVCPLYRREGIDLSYNSSSWEQPVLLDPSADENLNSETTSIQKLGSTKKPEHFIEGAIAISSKLPNSLSKKKAVGMDSPVQQLADQTFSTDQKKNENFENGLSSVSFAKGEVSGAEDISGRFINQLPIIPKLHLASASEADTSLNLKLPKKKLFEVGLFVGATTTEIINNTTRAAFDASSLVSLNPSISSHLGIQGVYHFTKSHSIVGSLTRLKVGQSTNQYLNGVYQKNEINLEFFRFQALYQLKFKQYEEQRNYYSLKVGPYVGLLSKKEASASVLTNSTSSYSETLDNLRRVDAGISFQVGRTSSLNNLVFDYGVSFDKGWVNLNRGTDFTPSSFDRTTTIDLGAYISVRYKL